MLQRGLEQFGGRDAIGGYAELMEIGLRGPVSSEQKKDLARIRNSQQHLLGPGGDLSRGPAVVDLKVKRDAVVVGQAEGVQFTDEQRH